MAKKTEKKNSLLGVVKADALTKLDKEKEKTKEKNTTTKPKAKKEAPPTESSGKKLREKPGRKNTVPQRFKKTGIQINPDHDSKIKMLILKGVFTSRDAVIDDALTEYLKNY